MARRKKINPPKRLRLRLPPPRIASLLKRVKVVGPKKCWEWDGHTDEHGYGQVSIGGRAMWVHRVFYAVFVRSIAEGREIDHRCRNHSCCNPHHLKQRTVASNRSAGNRERSRCTGGEEIPF